MKGNRRVRERVMLLCDLSPKSSWANWRSALGQVESNLEHKTSRQRIRLPLQQKMFKLNGCGPKTLCVGETSH
ncbi:hypothetical protein P5673_025585 [Acropora cervicornis]|uniref:Uncharacterized protein n=1 Tax=Acropora cervicornis TaxID=6130 RepID=A0AAD9UXF1_ACRCE|nr:hypothetical protein P5673_025585 [Acropora cervicornis]